MRALLPILIGVLAGAVAAAPVLYAQHKLARNQASLSFGQALACGLAPFMLLHVLLVGVWAASPASVVGFGVAAALTFLAGAFVAAIRALRGR